MPKTERNLASAFTLIEILIVVVILGILAAVVLANVTSASRQSREAVLREDLQFMRSQIGLYTAAHDWPPGVAGGGGFSESLFISQMTGFTDSAGNVGGARDNTYRFGPYISKMPINPVTEKLPIQGLGAGQDPASAVNESANYGWIYKPSTLQFYANSAAFGPSAGGAAW